VELLGYKNSNNNDKINYTCDKSHGECVVPEIETTLAYNAPSTYFE